MLGVPIFLHESDVIPGAVNRFLAHFALEVFTSFPNTPYFPKKKIILVGNPIRRELLEGNLETARNFFGLSGKKPILFILGGSQGAQRINDLILEILPDLLRDFELIHQCGKKNFQQVEAEAKVVTPPELLKFYHLFPFLNEEELKNAYLASDLIISRAGSGVIFEIAAFGKPSILIPLPESAQEHQIKNAYTFAQSGATIVIEEENFTGHFFLERLKYLFSYPRILEKMSFCARDFSRPRAAQIIATYLLEYLKRIRERSLKKT
jgi:UDP-N-acetylglucosamine--N-acetylmuramyl-(pentapeptide) pyrophosphoryl-undecaprenol N-acetylglucosamine transferase